MRTGRSTVGAPSQVHTEYIWAMWKSGDWVARDILPERSSSMSSLAVGQWCLKGHTEHVTASGSLTVVRYQEEILRSSVRPYAGAECPGLVQDNVSLHVVRLCRTFLDDKDIDATDWASHSPDLHPAENVWDVVVGVCTGAHAALMQVWEQIDPALEFHLLRSDGWFKCFSEHCNRHINNVTCVNTSALETCDCSPLNTGGMRRSVIHSYRNTFNTYTELCEGFRGKTACLRQTVSWKASYTS